MNGNISLVTGGAGFIGSHLCEALLKAGHKVVCADINDKSPNLPELLKNDYFAFEKINVNDHEQIKSLFSNEKYDYVFHYAAIVGVKKTEEKPELVMNDCHGIENILQLSCRTGVKKVVFASSSEVYGNSVQSVQEEDGPVNAKTPYSVTKLWGEQLLKTYYQKYGMPTTSLRFFNVYGPRQDSSDYGFVVGIFIKQALNNEHLTIYGNGMQTRDFVYIDDNIEAALKVINMPATNGEIINIGTGCPTTIRNLAKLVAKLAGSNSEPKFLEARKHDIKHRCPDVSKMIDLIKYTPETSLEDGLKKTIEWYKAYK